jgi:cysteine desulfuration protein SufE
MAGYPQKLTEWLDAFALVSDRQERIQMLIGIAERFRAVPASVATRPFPESHRVPDCESEAFVFAEERPDKTLNFHFAVENPQGISAMATAVILDETCSGAPPNEVAAVPSDIVYTVFGKELSMGKSMGLMSMVAMVRATARKCACLRAT